MVVLRLCFDPQVVIEVSEEELMHIQIGIFVVDKKAAEVLESPSIAIDSDILAWDEEVSEVEVFLHPESDVDGSYGKEESCLILLHLLHEGLLSLYESDYQLQGQDSPSSEISLWILSLEA